MPLAGLKTPYYDGSKVGRELMQMTVEYTGVRNRVSPATVELLIRKRSKGKSLRQLGQMFGGSYQSST